MANQEHLDILKQGVEAWNQWREEHPEIQPDLGGANLSNANLRKTNFEAADLTGADLTEAYLRKTNLRRADLKGANLEGANLRRADLKEANLEGANLRRTNLSRTIVEGANLGGANLRRTNLSNADLTGKANLENADLTGANLEYTDLTGANLRGANLTRAILVETKLIGATLTQCCIYGISVWRVQLEGAKQDNLVITRDDEPTITVDNIQVAQFIYLLLDNKEIRDVIDTITSKVVLILGRFTPERKVVLDAMRDELRKHNYLPILFDFDKPASRDLTETVSTLAHLARFIIVDLTDPNSVPHEVATVIPQTVVPVQPLLTLQPLLVEGKTVERREYAMFEDLRRRCHWVLPTFRYQDTANLLASLQEHIIEPSEQKAKELAKR